MMKFRVVISLVGGVGIVEGDGMFFVVQGGFVLEAKLGGSDFFLILYFVGNLNIFKCVEILGRFGYVNILKVIWLCF